MIKKYWLIVILTFASVSGFAQFLPEVYGFKKDWTTANSVKEAKYFMQPFKNNDSEYVCRYYTQDGPCIKLETFSDATLETPAGRFVWYNKKGLEDSSGTIKRMRKDGLWTINNTDGKPLIVKSYSDGILIKTFNYTTKSIDFTDGHSETFTENKAKQPSPDTSTGLRIPAEFSMGLIGWNLFLKENMKDFYASYIPKSPEKVIAAFVINKDGIVSDCTIENSINRAVDSEVLRVLKLSPAWKPASINGKNVSYRHKQSFTFQSVIE